MIMSSSRSSRVSRRRRVSTPPAPPARRTAQAATPAAKAAAHAAAFHADLRVRHAHRARGRCVAPGRMPRRAVNVQLPVFQRQRQRRPGLRDRNDPAAVLRDATAGDAGAGERGIGVAAPGGDRRQYVAGRPARRHAENRRTQIQIPLRQPRRPARIQGYRPPPETLAERDI